MLTAFVYKPCFGIAVFLKKEFEGFILTLADLKSSFELICYSLEF